MFMEDFVFLFAFAGHDSVFVQIQQILSFHIKFEMDHSFSLAIFWFLLRELPLGRPGISLFGWAAIFSLLDDGRSSMVSYLYVTGQPLKIYMPQCGGRAELLLFHL